MTMTVQPRHTKLGLAIREANWRYAAYALEELEEAFERIGEGVAEVARILDHRDDQLRSSRTRWRRSNRRSRPPMRLALRAAYEQLTAACNTCHRSADRGMVVIQSPVASPFPDQDLRPVKE